MREWLVIENSMKNGIFVSAEVRDEKGYIPRDVAEAICGRSMAGPQWFTREESEKMRAHPEWRDTEPPSLTESTRPPMNDDLIARLERATEGSRELDADVHELYAFTVARATRWKWFDVSSRRWRPLWHVAGDIRDTLHFLPAGWWWRVYGWGEIFGAEVQSHFVAADELRRLKRRGLYRCGSANGKSAPGALMAAIIRATHIYDQQRGKL